MENTVIAASPLDIPVRAQFETWYWETFTMYANESFSVNEYTNEAKYKDETIQGCWKAWQAAANAEREAAPWVNERIAQLEAERAYDQRNAAMSQAESVSLLIERDELEVQVAILREVLQSAIKAHGYTSGMLVDALNATSSDWLRKHDAGVLRSLVEGANGGKHGWINCPELLRMAAELEGAKHG